MDVIPGWLKELTDAVIGGVRAADEDAIRVDCHVYYNPFYEQWEVTLFLEETEVLGGERDGAIVPTPFSLDLTELMAVFDEVQHFHWQAQRAGEDDDLGPHVAVEGLYAGNNVWLRFLASPPQAYTRRESSIPNDGTS
ncbi:MAG: hypothetical protein D6725_00180 [Planctomycetota bacterium]|nr:MAG: hypothetical protein D6725_00180 [Planctomycetota bacterium]